MSDDESVHAPLWRILENWAKWQVNITRPGPTVPEEVAKKYDSQGTIYVDDPAAAKDFDCHILGPFKLQYPKHFLLIDGEAKASITANEVQTWTREKMQNLLKINRRTYNDWRRFSLNKIQQMIDDRELLKKLGAQ